MGFTRVLILCLTVSWPVLATTPPEDLPKRVKDIHTAPGPGSSSSSSPELFVEINGFVYFAARDGIHGDELWRTDGTELGTTLVKDLDPGPGSSIDEMVAAGGTLFISADELWKSDGTAAGTVLVKDIQPGSGRSDPEYLTVVGDTVYFQAMSGAA